MAKQTPATIFDAQTITENVVRFACSQVTAVRTDGQDDPVPPGWIVEHLIRRGVLGYKHAWDASEGWYFIDECGQKNRYGEPFYVEAYTQASARRPQRLRTDTDGIRRNTVSIVSANVSGTPPILTIERYAKIIAVLDTLIFTNARAASRTQIIGGNRKQFATLRSMFDDIAEGLPSFIDQEIANTIQRVDISVPFIGNDVYTLRTNMYNELLNMWGGLAPTAYKAERTQSAEVSAMVGNSIDNVYIMIDSVNRDCTDGEVPYKLVYTGYGARFDVSPATDPEQLQSTSNPGENLNQEGPTDGE